MFKLLLEYAVKYDNFTVIALILCKIDFYVKPNKKVYLLKTALHILKLFSLSKLKTVQNFQIFNAHSLKR